LHKTSRFGDVLINTAKVIFETHSLFCASGIHEVPDCRLIEASMWVPLLGGMRNQTSEAFAYIEREYNDVKGRVELQRHVVAQLHRVEADAGEAEAALNALLDDEMSKLRILDYLRRWLGDKPEEMPPVSST
jgi:hypothetical protein